MTAEKDPIVPIPPLHQWTDATGKVLLVRCGVENQWGFRWPESGKVHPPDPVNREASCEGEAAKGKLYGWAWGMIGGGKEPDYRDTWIVFAADPADVVLIEDKCGVAGEVEIVYCGTWDGAQTAVLAGQIAWVQQHEAYTRALVDHRRRQARIEEGAHATSESGAASATGERCIAALTGECGRIKVGDGSLGAVTARKWTWEVTAGAVVACRWKDGDTWHQRLLIADELGLQDGSRVRVIAGEVQP